MRGQEPVSDTKSFRLSFYIERSRDRKPSVETVGANSVRQNSKLAILFYHQLDVFYFYFLFVYQPL